MTVLKKNIMEKYGIKIWQKDNGTKNKNTGKRHTEK